MCSGDLYLIYLGDLAYVLVLWGSLPIYGSLECTPGFNVYVKGGMFEVTSFKQSYWSASRNLLPFNQRDMQRRP